MFDEMALSKISIDDDAMLRERVLCMMSLRNEKLTHMAKALRLDPGGLSGWLSGIQNRLSVEKKDSISRHLGLSHGYLSPNIVHKWTTDAETITRSMPILVSKYLLGRMTITPIYAGGQPSSCAYLSVFGSDVIVIIAGPRNTALQPPIVDPVQSGWGVNGKPAMFSVGEVENLMGSENLAAADIYLEITIRSQSKEKQSMRDWANLITDAISSGLSIDEAKNRLLGSF